MAILKNFFLEMLKGENKRFVYQQAEEAARDYTTEVQQEIDAKREQLKDRTDLETQFRAINTIFEVAKKDGTTEEEKTRIEDMIRTLLDTQLDARLIHEEAPKTRILPSEAIKDKYLDTIANDNGMDLTALLKLNPPSSTFHIKADKVGRKYCLKEDLVRVIVSTAEQARNQQEFQAVQNQYITPAGAPTLAAVQATKNAALQQQADTQAQRVAETKDSLRTSILSNPKQFLDGKSVKLPRFLRGGEGRTDVNEWAELLRRADTQDPNAKRLVEVIKDKPLGWSPNDLRDAIREGGNKKLSFKDITKSVFEENENKFFKTYESNSTEIQKIQPDFDKTNEKLQQATQAKANAEAELEKALTPEDKKPLRRQPDETQQAWEDRIPGTEPAIIALIEITRTANREIKEAESAPVRAEYERLTKDQKKREDLMVQSFEILQAMENIVEGEALQQQSYQFESQEGLHTEAVENPTDTYDIDLLLAGQTVETLENTKGLGTTTAVMEEVKEVFASMGASEKQIKNMDAGFVLRLITACYGMEQLIKNGNIVKNDLDGNLYLKILPSTFNETVTEEPKFQAIFASLDVQRGQVEFDREAADNFKMEMLSRGDQTAYARELATRAFANRGETLSMEEIEAGKTLRYNKTDRHLLAMVKDAESALEDLVTHRRYFDTGADGKDRLQGDKLLSDLQYFLNTGVDNYFQDENLDTVAILEANGIRITEGDSTKIKELDKKLKDLSEKAAKIDEKIAILEARQEQHETAERIAEIADLEQEKEDYITPEILELGEQRMTTMRPYIERLKTKLALTQTDTNPAQLSDYQKIFIQNGYAISGGRQMDEMLTIEEQKQAIIDKYADNPVVSDIFGQLEQSGIMRTISPGQLEGTAQAVIKGLEDGIQIESQPDETTGSSHFLFAVAGEIISTEGEGITGGRVGVGIPIKTPIPGITFNIGVGGGYTSQGIEGGIGIGGTGTLELDPTVRLYTSMNVGAGFQGTSLYLGPTASHVLEVQSGTWNLSAGVHGGFKINLTEGAITPAVAGTIGAKVDLDRYRERVLGIARNMTCTELVGDNTLTMADKIEVIKTMPGFKNYATEMASKNISPKTQERVLWDMYTDYAQNVQNTTVANMRPPLVTGFNISVFPVPPFVLPMISFAFAGKPKVYFSVPADPNALYTASNESLQSKLAEEIARQGGTPQVIIDAEILASSRSLSSLGYGEGEPYIVAREETTFGIDQLLSGELEAYNRGLNPSGINLESGTGAQEGLVNLQLQGMRGNVDIRIDPSMNGKLIAGDREPPTKNDLFLALEHLQGQNLIITREEFITPRREGGEYKQTRITIKSNPDPRNNFQQFEDLNSGLVSFRDNSNLDIHSGTQDNILTWEEYVEQKNQLVESGLTTIRFSEYQTKMEAFRAKYIRDAEPELRTEELAAFAVEFYETNELLCLNARLFDENIGEDYEKLITAINTALGYKATGLEMGYILSVIRKQTYTHKDRDLEEQARYRERNKTIFTRILVEKYGEETATQLLKDIEANAGRTMQIPATAEIYTVVAKKGAEGLCFDTMQTAELRNVTDYSTDSVMRARILSQLRPLPAENKEFMRTSLSLETRDQYYILKGPDSAIKLMEIYEDPTKLTQPAYKQVFDEFKALVTQLRTSEITGLPVPITTEYGAQLQITMSPEIYGGSLEYCDNPTVVINEHMKIGLAPGITASALEVTLQRLPAEVRKDMYEFLTGGTYKRETPPSSEKGSLAAVDDEQIDPEEFDHDVGEFEGGNSTDTPPDDVFADDGNTTTTTTGPRILPAGLRTHIPPIIKKD